MLEPRIGAFVLELIAILPLWHVRTFHRSFTAFVKEAVIESCKSNSWCSKSWHVRRSSPRSARTLLIPAFWLLLSVSDLFLFLILKNSAPTNSYHNACSFTTSIRKLEGLQSRPFCKPSCLMTWVGRSSYPMYPHYNNGWLPKYLRYSPKLVEGRSKTDGVAKFLRSSWASHTLVSECMRLGWSLEGS